MGNPTPSCPAPAVAVQRDIARSTVINTPRAHPMGNTLARDVPVAPDHDRRPMTAAQREAVALALTGLPVRHRRSCTP